MPQKTIEVPAGYAVIPIDLLRDRSIPARAKIIYANLWYMRNVEHKHPRTIAQIAKVSACGSSCVSLYVKLLKKKKWIDNFELNLFDDEAVARFMYS